MEREVAHRLAVGVSYMYVHGVDLIRARDVNLPPPVNVTYPVLRSLGDKLSWHLRQRGLLLDLAIDTVADVSVSALHQSAGPSHPAARVYQCFRERRLERLSTAPLFPFAGA